MIRSTRFFLKLYRNIGYELMALFRCYQELIHPFLFLGIIIILFPLGITCDPLLLKKISAGIFWVIILFLVLLMLDQLFRNDWKEGALEQLILLPQQLTLLVFVKLFVFWLVISVSLLIMVPILSISLFIPVVALKTLYLTILLGTPTLIFLGGIARTLTLGLHQSSLLVILIIIPFYIPVLIFASSAIHLTSMGLPMKGALAWLGVLMILSVSLSPFIISKLLRSGIVFS